MIRFFKISLLIVAPNYTVEHKDGAFLSVSTVFEDSGDFRPLLLPG